MKPLLDVALRSAWARRSTLVLVVLSVALSTLLLLGVERIRGDVRESFSQSVSGTDLIVGARTGAVQLLLYAVFRLGEMLGQATKTIEHTEDEMLPVISKSGVTLDKVNRELDKVDVATDSALAAVQAADTVSWQTPPVPIEFWRQVWHAAVA